MTMAFNFCLQYLHYLTGILKVGMSQDVEQMIITELLMRGVLRLIESVGID